MVRCSRRCWSCHTIRYCSLLGVIFFIRLILKVQFVVFRDFFFNQKKRACWFLIIVYSVLYVPLKKREPRPAFVLALLLPCSPMARYVARVKFGRPSAIYVLNWRPFQRKYNSTRHYFDRSYGLKTEDRLRAGG